MVTQLKVDTSSDNQPSKEQSAKLVSENLKESHLWLILFAFLCSENASTILFLWAYSFLSPST